jgi:hypothetical protein
MKVKERLRIFSWLKETKQTWQWNITQDCELDPFSVKKYIIQTISKVEIRW